MVLPSDHIIENVNSFVLNMKVAYEVANSSESIVTIGIHPTYPETGYGYIEVGKHELNKVYDVLSFREKPNFDIASEYVDSGRFLWNGGMFVFNSQTLFNAFKVHEPNHYKNLMDIQNSMGNLIGEELSSKVKPFFENFEKKSMDFAIMEKHKSIKVIPSDFGWSDVGDFNALAKLYKTTDKNINIGSYIVTIDAENNIIIQKHANKKTALLGIHNSVIVDDDEGLLIIKRDQTQRIKELLKKLNEKR